MTEYADLGAWALARLRALPSVTELVVDGADGIFESGELSSADLQEAQKRRRETRDDPNVPGQVLAVLVMDNGETGAVGNKQAACSVFVYDRGSGYRNVREAREAVIAGLVNQPVVLKRGASIVQVRYDERSGHDKFQDFDLDYERIGFSGRLSLDSADEYS